MATDEPKTYLVFGTLSGLQRAFLDEEMAKHGFVSGNPDCHGCDHERATILFVTQDANKRFDRSSYTIKCEAKNLLDGATIERIADKRELHLAMKRENPCAYEKYFARTWTLDEFAKMDYPSASSLEEGGGSGIYILRPSRVGFCSGRGIIRVTNTRELQRAILEYDKMAVRETVIVSEYIDDPALFEGRKFHIRAYLLVRKHASGNVAWSLAPMSKILTARLPYVRAQYGNADIHDTHADSTNGALFFPQHVARITPVCDPASITAQMNEICEACVGLIRDDVRAYEESTRGGFEVFGLDLMIARGRVILLEVNTRVGYATPNDPLFAEFQRMYFSWVWTMGYEPLLSAKMGAHMRMAPAVMSRGREHEGKHDGERPLAEFAATPVAGKPDTFFLKFHDTPIPVSAYARFARECENDISFGAIESTKLRELMAKARVEGAINLFQADSIRRHIIRQYNISNAWRIEGEMPQISREYDAGQSIGEISVARKLSPYAIFKGLMIARGHDGQTQARNILRDISLGKIAPSDVYSARDAAQYEAVREYDFESAAVQMRMAADADMREHNFINVLRNLGIRLSTQADLLEMARQSGEHPITPDVLFLSTVFVNGDRARWLDFKSYCGTPISFLTKSTVAQAHKYNVAYGNGYIVYEYGFVDSLPYKCVSVYAMHDIIESH
jgi:hypothetical protein